MSHEDLEALWYLQWPYDAEGVDPEFEMISASLGGFTARSSVGLVSIQALPNDGPTLFTMGGQQYVGIWHPAGDPPPPPPPGEGVDEAIIVNGGGWWTFTPVGYAPSGYVPPLLSSLGLVATTGLSEAETSDILDGNTVDTSQLLGLDSDLETILTLVKLDQMIATVTLMLSRLPPDGKFVAADGREVTVRELQALWARADFQVDPAHTADPDVERDFTGYGNGGVGQAIRNNGDPLFIVDLHYLSSYMNGTFQDLALHYVLHELMHVTVAGTQVVAAGGTFANTANPVESWTSQMAAALAAAGGLRYNPLFVPPGYDDGTWGPIGPATYVPPPPPVPNGGGSEGGPGGGQTP